MNTLPQQDDTPTLLLEDWAHWRLSIESNLEIRSHTGSNPLGRINEPSSGKLSGSRILWYGPASQQFTRFDHYLTEAMGKKHIISVALIYGTNGHYEDKATKLDLSKRTLIRLKIKAWEATKQYVAGGGHP